MRHYEFHALIVLLLWLLSPSAVATEAQAVDDYYLQAGHPSLAVWKLPEPSHPDQNKPNAERIALGRALFFDKRLSGDGDMSCATCHKPNLGWADGLKTAMGANGEMLQRSTPTIINSAYNHLQTWDGKFDSLEAQAISPLINKNEMGSLPNDLIMLLRNDSTYQKAFGRAYPTEGINIATLAKAIAAFERSVISANSPFDRWISGEQEAMTHSQVQGFAIFLDTKKGNCVVCHAPPNFTDDGFHNIGLELNSENPDYGRFELIPVNVLKNAFKTPTLRNIQSTAPYFHNGSAPTLIDVLNHYSLVDHETNALSPALSHTTLTKNEQLSLLDFLSALTDKQTEYLEKTDSNQDSFTSTQNDIESE